MVETNVEYNMPHESAALGIILLLSGLFFVIAGLTVRTFRYRYGGFRVPRAVGGSVYVALGVFLIWVAFRLAGQP